MAWELKSKKETHGPFETVIDLLEFWQQELDQDDGYWIENLSKQKKISKSDQDGK